MRNLITTTCFILLANILHANQLQHKSTIALESNAIAFTSLSYDRYIDTNISTKFFIGGDFILGTGFGHGSMWIAPQCGTLLMGPVHFFEGSVLMAFDISINSETRENSPGFKIGYRYISPKGVTLKTSVSILSGIDPMFFPSIGVGYSF